MELITEIKSKTGNISDFLSNEIMREIDISIFAGSGIELTDRSAELLAEFEYSEIPGFPLPSVLGHSGKLKFFKYFNKIIALFSGRIHLYENRRPEETFFNLALAREIGSKSIILTHAAGGLLKTMKPGDIMLLRDCIDFTNFNYSKILRTNDQPTKQNFIFDDQWNEKILSNAIESKIDLKTGTTVQVLGPSYETRAEIKMFRKFGAASIGMSTAVEAKIASALGMKICGFSLITNSLSENPASELTHEEVLSVVSISNEKLQKIIKIAIENCP